MIRRTRKLNLDEKYSFEITAGGQIQIYYFSVDEEGKPIKVGDGTFGAVFAVDHPNGEECVVKLLYKTQTLPQLGLPQLTEEIIEDFKDKFNINDTLKGKIEDLKERPKSLGSFALALQELNLPENQYCFLLDQTYQYSSNALKRFKHEIESSKRIREKLRKMERPDDLDGVIEITGGTEHFRMSPAYTTLENMFREIRIEVSDYALVMPYYKWTLKDLLERRIQKPRIRKVNTLPGNISEEMLQQLNNLGCKNEQELRKAIDEETKLEGEEKTILKNNIYSPTGYDILKSMGFEERIRIIMPYLLAIAQGVRALHLAGLYHHDLKPANIFVKDGAKVEAVVGDLGFIKPRDELRSSTSIIVPDLPDLMPLGTRHYRSPEQKDYFDICDVDIIHQDNNKGNKEVVLIVSDPKFLDTIIEAGDTLIFNKDKDRKEHIIAEIEKKSGDCKLTLRGDQESLISLLKKDKTQVTLYKKHQARTDLFGLGAIAFDLLTCGKSPERFYDNIRSYDTGEKRIDDIMAEYNQVCNFQSINPAAASNFAPFKHEQKPSEYTPPEFVKVILKCMLYKAKGTYFNPNDNLLSLRIDGNTSSQGDDEYYKAVDAVFEDLKNLHKEKFKGRDYDNELLRRTFREDDQKKVDTFSEIVNELQKLSSPKDIPRRLADGIVLFKQLVELVRETVSKAKNPTFFAEMLPQNIVFKTEKELGFFFPIYTKEDDYKENLKNDDVYPRITRDAQNPYVPDNLIAMRRGVELEQIRSQEAYTFRYSFLDSSPHGSQTKEGDWIVINKRLWQVKSVSGHQITLDPVLLETDPDVSHDKSLELALEEDKQLLEGIYYQNLEPCKYYLSMLGIYLHHIFWANIGQTTQDKPLAVDMARKAMALYGSSAVEISRRELRQVTLESIFWLITQMYLQLTFHENDNSFYRGAINHLERLNAVMNRTQELQKKIERFLGVNPTALDHPDPNLFNKDDKWLKEYIPQDFLEKLDFNEYIFEFMNVHIGQNGWKRFFNWGKKR